MFYTNNLLYLYLYSYDENDTIIEETILHN